MNITERVARAIWEKRREIAARSNIILEEWGDGAIPRLNGIDEEANAAIGVTRPEFERIKAAYSPKNDDTVWVDDRTPLPQFVDSIINSD